jgi:hypothetical protein
VSGCYPIPVILRASSRGRQARAGGHGQRDVKAQFASAVDAVYRAGHWPTLVTVSFIVSALAA